MLPSLDTPPIDVPEILETFSGEVRLFPLPNLVLFPDGIAPLRVFEPRYVQMTKDALADDEIIATALLRPGWEVGETYQGNPPIFPVVTVGKILRHSQVPTGKFELLLYGLFRARILAEVPHEPYRKARVTVLSDEAPTEQAERIARRMRRAFELVPGKQSMIWEMRRMANQLRGVDAAAGRYADAVADVSDLTPGDRYELLAEQDVLQRFERLIELLEEKAYQDAPSVPPRTRPNLN